MTSANAAIKYCADVCSTSGERLMGRQVAAEGFLTAFLRHADVRESYCFAARPAAFDPFAPLSRSLRPDLPGRWLPASDPFALATADCLFHPGPVLRVRAWDRRGRDETAYSLCGVAHTICTAAVMNAVGALLTDPPHASDALICTSNVVKSSVDRMLGQ